jgi:hypothetical protein
MKLNPIEETKCLDHQAMSQNPCDLCADAVVDFMQSILIILDLNRTNQAT